MIEDIMKEYTSNVAKEIDNKMYNFLEENSYFLERGNVQQILELKEKLAKEDKQVRVESAIVGEKINGEHLEAIMHSVIFFDSISHPLNRENVEKMIAESYARKHLLDKENK